MSSVHLVIPGQVLASSSTSSEGNEEQSFLRGHGTYVERGGDGNGKISNNNNNNNNNSNQDRLIASVCGMVQRVNKLITVVPFCELYYQGQVGDLVVGRVTSVTTSRWMVNLVANQRDAQLPLSGVHLPGGVQRVRTAQDQRDMRLFLQEGDLISAEVHKVQPSDGSLMLHTRSYRYSKLENGCLIRVPPALIPRLKNHSLSLIQNTLDVLWGINGSIWIQRKVHHQGAGGGGVGDEDAIKDLAEIQEQLRQEHATTPVLVEERQSIARLRNAIECLRLVHSMVTPDHAEMIYQKSLEFQLSPPSLMLLPSNVLLLTEFCRRDQNE